MSGAKNNGVKKKKPTYVSDHTTATAVREGPKEKPPEVYNPYVSDQAPPLRPEEFMSETRADGTPLEFRFDNFVKHRRFLRRNIHGESEEQFDAELIRPSAARLRAIASHDIEADLEEDPAIMEERDAAEMDQPQEVLDQARADFLNPGFRALLAKNTTRLHGTDNADVAAPAVPKPILIPKSDDFLNFDTPKSLNRPVFKGARQAATIDDDDNVPVEMDPEPDKGEGVERVDNSDAALKVIGDQHARNLLDYNPLSVLALTARCDLMRVPDIACVFSVLNPIVLQHEEHRRHYNIVELIRELALCGCKYDGCLQVESPQRLGDLLDSDFYGSFLEEQEHGGRVLVGGHEHFETVEENDGKTSRQRTRLAIFKFFLVQRNVANSNLLQLVDENSARTVTNETTGAVNAENEAMRLNRAGLYDLDIDGTDKDASEMSVYSSMHNIKYLAREFMLALRVVCVEVDKENEEYGEVCVSDDESIYVPPNAKQGAVMAEMEERDEETFEGATLLSESDTTTATTAILSSSLSSSKRARIENREVPVRRIEVEQDEAETDMTRNADAALPDERLTMTIEEAGRLVGTYKRNLFLQRVNGKEFGVLCPRAFMFYAINNTN